MVSFVNVCVRATCSTVLNVYLWVSTEAHLMPIEMNCGKTLRWRAKYVCVCVYCLSRHDEAGTRVSGFISDGSVKEITADRATDVCCHLACIVDY